MTALGKIVKKGMGIAARCIKALGKPSLIQETSRFNIKEAFKHPIKTRQRLMNKPEDVLKGVILNPSLEERLSFITVATRNTWKYRATTYRNLLLYGPPGTGKTLFVERFAHHCGMHYAIMSGGDVIGMGREGGLAVSKVFDWASSSSRGFLLIVEDAEAFLQKRNSENVSKNALDESALYEFLYRTEELSDRLMLVLTTNTPEQLDWAVSDRMDELVEFELPGLPERERMIQFYFDKNILIPATEGKRKFKLETFDYGKVCSEIAQMTEGFSGREIAKLSTKWQYAAYASDDGVLTKDGVMEEAKRIVIFHKQKSKWFAEEEASKQISDSSRNGSLHSEKTSLS